MLKDSLTLEQIKELHEQDSLQNKLFPLEYGLKGLPSIKIKDSHIKKRILNGQNLIKMNLITKLKTKLYLLMMIQKKY